VSNHLPAAKRRRCGCGLLVPASDMADGVCSHCRDGDDPDRAPPGPTDAEIDRALARLDYLFGRDWFEAK